MNNFVDNLDKKTLETLFKVELSRREGGFWYFCQLMIPAVYKESRPYLKKLCNDLENFWNDDTKKYLTLSIPPRHCKSLTISLFVCYLLQDNFVKIMTGSYNEDFSALMCKNIRDRIQEEKIDRERIVYSDIYKSKIQKGAAQSHKFKLDGSPTINVLSTSVNGSATGFGANLIILDDMIKSATESYNLKQKEKVYDWFVNTMLSRLEGEKQKVIIIGTRWQKDDLIGKVLDWNDDNIVEINLKALGENDEMLCEEILNREQYEELKAKLSEEIFYANYQQQPMDLKDKMYNNLNTYKEEELYYTDRNGEKKQIDFERIINYTDTADTGSDWLCSITGGVYKNKVYILDVYYTKSSMEYTEGILASKLKDFEVHNCRIEGNNGGRGFARNVGKEYRDLGGETTIIKTFSQTKNKQTRIYSNRHNVMNYIYFPYDCDSRFSQYFKDMMEYKAESQNEHDDAPDATTGIIETCLLLGLITI